MYTPAYAPDGRVPCDNAIVGEAPADEEMRLGRGFVGPSGKLLWPLLEKLAGLRRSDCYVDNLCHHPLDNDVSGDAKMSPEEFEACRRALLVRLANVRPDRILAVGALAARALIGDAYISMEVNNGMAYVVDTAGMDDLVKAKLRGAYVVPCWHPAAALHDGGKDRKDPLAWMGAALSHFMHDYRVGFACPPTPTEDVIVPGLNGVIGIDTEGTPDDPICMTWATNDARVYLTGYGPQRFFAALGSTALLIYHNAPWDWAVLEAMGVKDPWRRAFEDTMEMAYLRQTEPQGLKDLAARHLGLRMKTWQEMVMPYHDELITAYAQGLIDASTKTVTHSAKGRLLKTPKLLLEDEALKPIKRALGNPDLLRDRLPDFPPPTLDIVPRDMRIEYATMDAWVTQKLWGVLHDPV